MLNDGQVGFGLEKLDSDYSEYRIEFIRRRAKGCSFVLGHGVTISNIVKFIDIKKF